jgi:hypothetical protein
MMSTASHSSSWWFFSNDVYKEKHDKYFATPLGFFLFSSVGNKVLKYLVNVFILLNAHSNEIEELCKWH